MGFPSPATDYAEQTLTPELLCRVDANCQVIETNTGYAVIDRSLKPCDGSLLVCSIDNEFRIKRYRTHPRPHLVNLENGKREKLPDAGEGDTARPVFGVITYIINDARTGEFDDCPVM